MALGDATKIVSFTKSNAESSEPKTHTTLLVEFIFTCPGYFESQSWKNP